MSHEKLRPEFLFDELKIEKLKQIAPECIEDGKINFETLKQNLGEWAQDEDGEVEHFGLFWPGKKDARRIAAIPPEGTLVPVYGEGLKTDGTPDKDGVNDSKNIFIEGENLEVLKILQKSYAGKIKMIYIDPPYNTGNDFLPTVLNQVDRFVSVEGFEVLFGYLKGLHHSLINSHTWHNYHIFPPPVILSQFMNGAEVNICLTCARLHVDGVIGISPGIDTDGFKPIIAIQQHILHQAVLLLNIDKVVK